MRVIVGGIGYPDLCDYSIGILVQEQLSARRAPANVIVEDLSYNPIAIIQRLNDEQPDNRFGRVVVVSAVKRGDRAAGVISCYRWDGGMPPDDEVQRAVTDAVTGIIAMENTLVIARYFGALPDEVVVIEVEPETHEFGAALSPEVSAAFERACDTAWSCAIDDSVVAALPMGSLALTGTPSIRFG
ncbi:MAG: hydrogenase maturation protease [Gemmatimonadales bacterium]